MHASIGHLISSDWCLRFFSINSPTSWTNIWILPSVVDDFGAFFLRNSFFLASNSEGESTASLVRLLPQPDSVLGLLPRFKSRSRCPTVTEAAYIPVAIVFVNTIRAHFVIIFVAKDLFTIVHLNLSKTPLQIWYKVDQSWNINAQHKKKKKKKSPIY